MPVENMIARQRVSGCSLAMVANDESKVRAEIFHQLLRLMIEVTQSRPRLDGVTIAFERDHEGLLMTAQSSK